MTRKFTAHRPGAARIAKGAEGEATPEIAKPPARPVTRDRLNKAWAEKLEALRRQTSWPKEIGGPEGPEPTRYGDWERKGICSDF